MVPTETGVLERAVQDIVKKMLSVDGIVEAGADSAVVGRSTPLDLVVWNTVNGMLGETRPPLKKIEHLDALKPEQFARFLEAYVAGRLEVSEKVDGSAQVSFGSLNGRLWTQTKNGVKRFSAGDYPDRPAYRAVKRAHEVLSRYPTNVAGRIPEGATFVADVLHTAVPNTIEYGKERIVVHGVNVGGRSLSTEAARRVVEDLASMAGGMVDEDMTLEFKRVLTKEELALDLSEELVYLHHQDARPAVHRKLLWRLEELSSAYGPAGGVMEGLVFFDPSSGLITKVVDREGFTKLNKFMWNFRERLGRGVKQGGVWRPGVVGHLRSDLAERVLGSKEIKSPGFVAKLSGLASRCTFPQEAVSRRQRLDHVLKTWLDSQGVAESLVKPVTDRVATEAFVRFDKLKREWTRAKADEVFVEVKGRRHVMHPLIVKRTDEAFLQSARELVDVLSAANGGSVHVLRCSLGESRLEKIVVPMPEEIETLGEATPFDQAPTAVAATQKNARQPRPDRGQIQRDASDVVQAFKDKLAKRGIVPVGEDKPEVLGTGTQGSAFELKDGRVLKVTMDQAEAQAASKLKGKGNKHIAKIFDVFKFPESHSGVLYGVVTERLLPIPGTHAVPAASTGEAEALNNALTYSYLYDVMESTKGPWDRVYEVMGNALRNRTEDMPEAEASKVQKRFEDSQAVLERYGIPGMVDELFKNGIGFKDFHAGNIMKKPDGDYVLIDLGYSNVPGGQEPEVLERVEEASSVETIKRHHPEIELAVDFHEGLLRKHGLVVHAEMGAGANGVAYSLGLGDKVLKVTKDLDEARASNLLKGKSLKHVVKFFEVFKFPPTPGVDTPIYGIVQEACSHLSTSERSRLLAILRFVDRYMGSWYSEPAEKVRQTFDDIHDANPDLRQEIVRLLGDPMFESILDALEELRQNGVEWHDVHADNLMKRNGKLVAIDLGVAASGGKEPDVLERAIVETTLAVLRESRADRVGVTIGRYQPFHRGHAEVIRRLAAKFDRVLVIVAGNTRDKKNPFSYDLRIELLKRSLPDVLNKVEIHRAEVGGKGSGFVPGVLSDIIKDKNSSLEADVAVTVLVGEDRFQEMQAQMQRAVAFKEKGGELYFDPTMAVVERLPDVKDDDSAARVSGTRVREALLADQKEAVESMMDPHLVSNSTDFEEMYSRMRDELGVKPKKGVQEVVEGVVTELLKDIGGTKGIEAVLTTNAQKLASSRWKVTLDKLRPLGSGQEGVAYSMGNGRVLKVTTDEKEAVTSYALVGKGDTKHVVHVYDVFRFDPAPGITQPVYGVVAEELAPLPHDEIREVDELTDELEAQLGEQAFLNLLWEGDWDALLETLRASLEADTGKEAGLPQTDPRVSRKSEKRLRRYVSFFEKYQIPEMMRELHGLGVKFADYHGGNLMKRGPTYVINDLGRSESPSKKRPPTLDNVVAEVVGKLVEQPFDGIGNSMTGVRAGSSAVSTFKNRVGPGTKADWQSSLDRLPAPNSGSAKF